MTVESRATLLCPLHGANDSTSCRTWSLCAVSGQIRLCQLWLNMSLANWERNLSNLLPLTWARATRTPTPPCHSYLCCLQELIPWPVSPLSTNDWLSRCHIILLPLEFSGSNSFPPQAYSNSPVTRIWVVPSSSPSRWGRARDPLLPKWYPQQCRMAHGCVCRTVTWLFPGCPALRKSVRTSVQRHATQTSAFGSQATLHPRLSSTPCVWINSAARWSFILISHTNNKNILSDVSFQWPSCRTGLKWQMSLLQDSGSTCYSRTCQILFQTQTSSITVLIRNWWVYF